MLKQVLKRCGRALPYTLLAAGAILVIALSYLVFLRQTTISSDLSTYLLPAVAREEGLGLLYVDFLDIKPPLIFSLFVPWIAIFGSSLQSMWILYALLLLAMFAGFILVLLQELPPWLAVVMFGFTAVSIVYFTMLEEFFFVTEALGVTLAVWALVLARWRPHNSVWFYCAALLIGAAGQVKEVFIFAPLALVPMAWTQRYRLRSLGVLLLGIVSAYVFTALVLLWWGDGVLPSYFDALQIKRERFPFPTPIELLSRVPDHVAQLHLWFPWFIIFVLAAVILGVLHVIRMRRTHVAGRPAKPSISWGLEPGELMLLLFLVFMYLGFLWQGSDLLKYFALSMVFPIYLALAVAVRQIQLRLSGGNKRQRVMVGIILIMGLAPSLDAVAWSAGVTKSLMSFPFAHHIGEAESESDMAFYERVRAVLEDGRCLHVAYGWQATAHYLYAQIPPCTRFTLPPLVAQTPALWQPLEDALLASPPGVLILEPDRVSTDVMVFPFDEVASACYQRREIAPSVYVPRGNEEATRDCINGILTR